jgi:hypothetical protein
VSLRVYDDFGTAGYSRADYRQKWMTPDGPGERAVEDTRGFSGGRLHVSAVRFRTGSDAGVDDHRKYLAVSARTFAVRRNARPAGGGHSLGCRYGARADPARYLRAVRVLA